MAYVEYEADGKTIKARVQQKTDTLANWMANPMPLKDGEPAFVITGEGQPLQIRLGWGGKRFSELPNWIDFNNAQRVAAQNPGVLVDDPSEETRYMEVTAIGTYTYGGNTLATITEDGYKATFWWTGTEWISNGSVRVKGDKGDDGDLYDKFYVSDFSLDGYFNKNNGTIVNSEEPFRRSGYIKNEGHDYYLNLNLITSYTAGVVTFDSSGNFISSVTVPTKTLFKIKFDSNVAYFGLSTNIASDTSHKPEAYYKGEPTNKNVEKGDKIALNFSIVNKYINKFGEEVTLSGVNSTPYIDVSSYSNIIVFPKQLSINNASFVFFDEQNRVVSRVISDDLKPQLFDLKNLGIKKLRACNFNGEPEVYEAVITDFSVQVGDLNPNLNNLSIIDVTWNDGGYINTSNVVIPFTSFSYSNAIDISSYSNIGLVTDRNNSDAAKNLFLDSSGNVVSVIEAERGKIKLLKRPDSATHIRLSKNTSNNSVILFAPASVTDRVSLDFSYDDISFSVLNNPQITWDNGYYYNSNGEKISLISYKASNKIALATYTHIVLYSNRIATEGSKNLFLDSSGNVVSVLNTTKGERSIIKIPSNATHLVLSDSMNEPIRPIVQLARNPIKEKTKFYTLQDIQALMVNGYFKQTPSYSTGLSPSYVNYQDFGMIRPQAVATQAIFLENTVSVPQSGVCLISSEGQLCAVINGVKYLINLTKV